MLIFFFNFKFDTQRSIAVKTQNVQINFCKNSPNFQFSHARATPPNVKNALTVNWQKNRKIQKTKQFCWVQVENCKKSAKWQNFLSGEYQHGLVVETSVRARRYWVPLLAWQHYWVHKCLERRLLALAPSLSMGRCLSVLSLFSWIVALDTRSVADENFSARHRNHFRRKQLELLTEIEFDHFWTLPVCCCCLRSWSKFWR